MEESVLRPDEAVEKFAHGGAVHAAGGHRAENFLQQVVVDQRVHPVKLEKVKRQAAAVRRLASTNGCSRIEAKGTRRQAR